MEGRAPFEIIEMRMKEDPTKKARSLGSNEIGDPEIIVERNLSFTWVLSSASKTAL